MPRTPEVVPRRQGASTLAQIAAAVLSGAAAMYAIQSYQAPMSMTTNASPKDRQDGGAAAPPTARRQPTLSEPLPVPPPPKLAPSSMLVRKEPGGALQGILAGGTDDPERTPGLRQAARPQARLTPRSLGFSFGPQDLGADGIGRGFNKIEFRPMFNPRAQASGAKVKSSTRLLDKPTLRAQDILTPSGLRPEDAPEPEFWTEDRVQRVVGSGLIALVGLCYLFFSSGAFDAWRGKSRPNEEEAA